VVDLVKFPQKRHDVKEAVNSVGRKIGENYDFEELQNPRLGADHSLKRRVHRPMKKKSPPESS